MAKAGIADNENVAVETDNREIGHHAMAVVARLDQGAAQPMPGEGPQDLDAHRITPM